MNRNTLLIVDDMEMNRAILRSLFQQDYNILEAENGQQGLMLLNHYKDTIAAMLLDIVMPGRNGYEVLNDMSVSGLLEIVPVIVITAEDTSESEVRAFDLGASDIVKKPFEPSVVRRRVNNVVELNRHKLHLEDLVEEQASRLRESKAALTDALSSVIEHRSLESGQHVLRIRMFTKILLEDVMVNYPEYGLDNRTINLIASASALHDIGKIAIPDAILNKPGPLTKEEFQQMKTHSVKGCEILASLNRMHDEKYLRYAYNICRYHHERWDGNGYPDGLKGENIPICAQAVGIADAYDALTTDRVYKKAYSPAKAYNMILNQECGVFSPRLLECFKNVKNAFIKLTHDYGDGMSAHTDLEAQPPLDQYKPGLENTLELGQLKYFAMLRYENSTVVELDIDTGIYHLVYMENNDFDLLRSEGLFRESYQTFVEKAVHPDDRMEMLKRSHIFDFLTSGAVKHSRKCRIYHHASGSYTWYDLTTLRINMSDPNQHKILLVWRQSSEHKNSCDLDAPVNSIMYHSMIGFLQCLNDNNLTLLNVNDGFISLFGYGREELEQSFHNRFIEMIHPDDRANVRRQFLEQQSASNNIELEYRITAKDGRIIWIMDKTQLYTGSDGLEYMDSVLMDINQTKSEQEKLRLTLERHKIILNQTNDIIFEWDIFLDKIYYSHNWLKKFGYQPITEEISLRIPQASHIMPEDMPNFVKFREQTLSGRPYGETELRIANAEGHYIWCRVRATTQFNDTGEPVKAIGVILDIDSEKRHTQDLLERAEQDNLTRLFNKNAARRRIEHFIKQLDPSETGAMMIVDLDNFKHINDNFGHMFGDAVLIETASQLRKIFHPQDIISRIGGDEFLVYMHCISSPDQLTARAKQLVTSLREILADQLRHLPLSCSVGVAACPGDASCFEDLYQCCDLALYAAKAKGKNQYAMYDKRSMSRIFGMNSEKLVTANTRIESDETIDFETAAMIQQVSGVLYQAVDVAAAINTALEMIGRKYDVSRAYIFEESQDGFYCRNTFEWCREGVQAQKDSLQHVSYGHIGDYYENFDINGVFYCSDIASLPKAQYEVLANQNIKAILQCAISNNGLRVGFVGFDDCTGTRLWNQNHIRALTVFAELLSTTLLKMRAQERLTQATKDLHTLLNTQNSWIYVIDPDTFRLNYINAKTREIAPEAKVGMHCHQAFFQRGTPCSLCPAKGIRQTVNHTMEIFNPFLQVWSLADASLIRWAGKDACLLCCHDITPYKQPAPESQRLQSYSKTNEPSSVT